MPRTPESEKQRTIKKLTGKNIEIANAMFANKASQRSVAKELGCHPSTIANWRRHMTPEEKQQHLDDIEKYRIHFATKAVDIIEASQDLLIKELNLRSKNLEETGVSQTKDLRELATVTGIEIDKVDNATGKATARIEVKLDDKTSSMLEKFLKRQNSILEEKKEEYIDAEYEVLEE